MTVLELSPAMPSLIAPDWPGASWVGQLDARALAIHDDIRLLESSGYTNARLLVRDGAAVRGFVDVGVHDGLLDRDTLDRAVTALAPAPPVEEHSGVLPSVTVVVCTRDRPTLLRVALHAILDLDYPDFDVVVVDNASATSATRDLVRHEFAGTRVALVDESQAGLARARNTGLLQATGTIVAYTDDDVLPDRGWLRELVRGFGAAPEVACVTGLVPSGELRSRVQCYFDERVSWSKNLEPRRYSLADPPTDLPLFPFCVGQYGTGANFALRRSAAMELRGFDTAFGVGTRTGGGEDIDLFTRVILDGRMLVVQPSAIVWHRHRDDLEALRVQARGYGTGLGAWLAKVMLTPRTAWMAVARSPRALAHLLALPRRRPAPAIRASAAGAAARPSEWERTVARVAWLELAAVASGPLRYLRQRADGASVMAHAAPTVRAREHSS